jgi:hypothetical protein
LTKRFREALSYAARLHSNQKRKGTDEPYIGHLLGVTSLVFQHNGDEDEAIAGPPHDAPEDQGGRATLLRIRRRFGKRVAAIVEGCSDSFEIPKPPWLERKKEHLATYREMAKALKERGSDPLMEELGRVVSEIERLALRASNTSSEIPSGDEAAMHMLPLRALRCPRCWSG